MNNGRVLVFFFSNGGFVYSTGFVFFFKKSGMKWKVEKHKDNQVSVGSRNCYYVWFGNSTAMVKERKTSSTDILIQKETKEK